MVSEQIDIAVKYRFSDLGEEGTKVLQGSKVTFKGFIGVIFKLFGFLLRSSSCRAAQEEMESLKRYCEGQPASAMDDHGL
ncbi:MAG: hypothetical protein ACI8W8_002785 [Rhodothermales bacterium]|jgi:hypothetical protein